MTWQQQCPRDRYDFQGAKKAENKMIYSAFFSLHPGETGQKVSFEFEDLLWSEYGKLIQALKWASSLQRSWKVKMHARTHGASAIGRCKSSPLIFKSRSFETMDTSMDNPKRQRLTLIPHCSLLEGSERCCCRYGSS